MSGRLHLLNGAFERRAGLMRAGGVLLPQDLLLVDAVAPRFGESDPEVLLGLAFAVRAPRVGHVGVHLPSLSGRVDDERATWRSWSPPPEGESPLDWPDPADAWEAAVLASPMVGLPEQTGRPFVLQRLGEGSSLVMTRRMWREQERLAEALRLLASSPAQPTGEQLERALEILFEGEDSEGSRAVRRAAERRLTVITGGPGTGKTYSIKRLIALLLGAADRPVRVELAAPTGKAAARMAEAIAEDLAELPVDPEVRQALAGLRPRTLHKLLGVRRDGSSRHGSEAPLPADLVVVDEASMIDLALMRRLLEAIPTTGRLVLLGDRDQLASVEAGTVLADLVGPVLDGPVAADQPLREAVVSFRTNHRFGRAPTVAALVAALQRRVDDRLGQVDRWMRGTEVAAGETTADRVTHVGLPPDGRPTEQQLDRLAGPYLDEDGFVGALAAAVRAHGPDGDGLRAHAFHAELLRRLGSYRVLAVHRRGPLGVEGLERAMVHRARSALDAARRAHEALPDRAVAPLPAEVGQWLGRPILVTRNSYEVGLVNGDIGIVLPTEGGLAAVFPSVAGGVGPTRSVALSRLPEHTGAFAMTVHKSQGSQFPRIALVLAGRDSPIQTRELVYTAITRTSSRLDWLGCPLELRRALRRRVGRASGLGDLLWSR